MSALPFDFRNPGRLAGDLEQRLAAWLRGLCTRAPAKWSASIPFQLELELLRMESLTLGAALARLTDAVVGYRIALGEQEVPSLLVWPRPLLLLLFEGMLGDSGTQLPADRPLTSVEDSLCAYFVEHLLVPSMKETWLGIEPIVLGVREQEPNPKYVRLCPPDTKVIVSSFAARGAFGEQEWSWIVPQDSLLEQLTRSGLPSAGRARESQERTRMETLVRDLPVEISVDLGTVELPLAVLARLQAGDLVLLNQRVSEPLAAALAGIKRFHVWPGRVGSQQAIQIDSLI